MSKDRYRRAALPLFGVALGLGGEVAAPTSLLGQRADCPVSIPIPVLANAPAAPPDSTTRTTSYWRSTHAFERASRGVGILETVPGERGGPPGYDWLPEVTLPLYARPGEEQPTLWMDRGWWVSASNPNAERRPIMYRGMLETSYEESRLVVMTARADGWIQLYVDIGPIGRGATDGLLWTHACLLDLGDTGLELRTWEEIFRGPSAPPLSFLGEGRHALRTGPREDATASDWLDADDEVVILEFRGDWARVRALMPGIFLAGCLGEEWGGRTVHGWIRWRDPAAGTLLWYPTRGC